MATHLKVIISGGGTGGHIFPAISIANALKEKDPDTEILFVGAEGRMEMQKVPAAGYEIVGLPIMGLDRKRWWRNFKVLYKLFVSKRRVKKTIREFAPHVAVGVGGYASAPTLQVAASMGIPTVLQEQNSYAGLTNKMLSKHAHAICVAYDEMGRFFPKEKLVLTGNPIRQELLTQTKNQEEALQTYNWTGNKKTVLILGGSLGARTINEAVKAHLSTMANSSVQFIWQTGKLYIEDAKRALEEIGNPQNIYASDFVTDMATAYKAADLVISRAGASSISEIALLGKASILVPSPNVAEDHQTKNAQALVKKQAALMITDAQAVSQLIPTALTTVEDQSTLRKLSEQVRLLAHPDAANVIAQKIIDIALQHQKNNL